MLGTVRVSLKNNSKETILTAGRGDVDPQKSCYGWLPNVDLNGRSSVCGPLKDDRQVAIEEFPIAFSCRSTPDSATDYQKVRDYKLGALDPMF